MYICPSLFMFMFHVLFAHFSDSFAVLYRTVFYCMVFCFYWHQFLWRQPRPGNYKQP